MQRFRPMLLILLAIFSFSIVSYSSTVTLTGTCPNAYINGTAGNLSLSITNSGNGTATNMVLEPIIYGASIRNSSAYIQIVQPETEYQRNFYIYNATGKGSYIINFLSTYAQSGNSYSTIFVCLADIGTLKSGPLSISAAFKNGKIVANISSASPSTIHTAINIEAPPDFNINSPSRNLTIGPYATLSEVFNLTTPNYTSASFPVIAELSYKNNSTHYATLSEATVTFAAPIAKQGYSKITLGFAAVGIILIVLIGVSVAKKLKNKNHKENVNP